LAADFLATAIDRFLAVSARSTTLFASNLQILQQRISRMPNDLDPGPGDLLLGARAITSYVNTLLDPTTPITDGQFYAWVERGHVPVARVGNRIIGSKQQIRQTLSGQTPVAPRAMPPMMRRR
jgi:hypothetical protein